MSGEKREIDYEDYSLEEIHEMDEYNMLSQDLDDEGSIFDDKLEIYRNEI